MKFAITAAAGLAFAAGASADVSISEAGPFLIGGGQTVELWSGNLSGNATTFDYDFFFSNPQPDSSWASDFMITITAANGNSVSIGAYQSPTDLFPSYDGPGSNPTGTYMDGFDISSFNLGGSGLWTITMTNDWIPDPTANNISNFNATIGGVVPTPGALSLFGIAGLAAARRRR